MNAEIKNVYDRMQTSLRDASKHVDDSILCPLCLGIFEFSDIRKKVLTKEHIIPQALGGKRWVITCKKCNNSLGSDVDADLAKAIQAEDSMAGNGTLPVTLRVDGHRTAAEMAWTNDPNENVKLNIIKKATDPKEEQGTLEAFKRGIPKINFDVHFGYRIGRYNTGALKAAYLACFDKLGYSYILSDTLAKIRKQLNNPKETDLDLSPLFLRCELPPELPYEFLLTQAQILDCYMVLLFLRSPYKIHTRAVFMPKSDSDFDSLLEKLAQKNKSGWQAQLTINIK